MKKKRYVGKRVRPMRLSMAEWIWVHKKILIPILLIAIVTLFVGLITQRSGQIIDGRIMRTYEEIFCELEEEPEDITAINYESHIPSIILKDIKRMKSSAENIKIEYRKSDNTSRILISKPDDGGYGIEVEVSSSRSSDRYAIFSDNISFYKNEDRIVIYGTYYNNRRMNKCHLSMDEESYDYIGALYENTAFDLWGTDLESYDYIKSENANMTLVKQGRKFSFFRNGEQLEVIEEFPGKDILEFSYNDGYILDSAGDLYYVYYSTLMSKPWIKFVKVAENIDSITEESVKLKGNEGYRSLEFIVYLKNGKRYSGIVDYYTERSYGIYNGNGKRVAGLADEPDFTVRTVCLDDESICSITLKREGLLSTYYDWLIHYEYETGADSVYIEKRLNGLDCDIVRFIPQEKLDPYDGLELTEDYIQTIKEELKAIYAEYE